MTNTGSAVDNIELLLVVEEVVVVVVAIRSIVASGKRSEIRIVEHPHSV